MRVIYSRADAGKIAEYRENLTSAMQKFEVCHQVKTKRFVLYALLASISYQY
jgi:hypothetical protein